MYKEEMRKEQLSSYKYIESLTEFENSVKVLARKNAETLGLEGISISKTEALLIQFLAKQSPRHKIVEIGTLTGLSALYFLEILEANGELWTLEKSVEHAELAKQVLNPFIAQKKCHLVVGDAREKLLEIQNFGPFDLVFIDGNKAAYLDYWNWAVKNISENGLIIIDNVFLSGAVWGYTTAQKFSEKQISKVHSTNLSAYQNEDFDVSLIPTEEGLLVARKKEVSAFTSYV